MKNIEPLEWLTLGALLAINVVLIAATIYAARHTVRHHKKRFDRALLKRKFKLIVNKDYKEQKRK